MASSHSAYFSSRAVPCEAYASSELSLKSVAVMSLEQLCGALSNIINEALWRPTIVVGLFLCDPTLISQGCSVVVGVAHRHTPSGSPHRAWMGEGGQRSQSSDFLKEMALIFCYPFDSNMWDKPSHTHIPWFETKQKNCLSSACTYWSMRQKTSSSNSKRNKTQTRSYYLPGGSADVFVYQGFADYLFSWKQRRQSGIFFTFLWWHYRPSWYSDTKKMFLEYS